MSITNRQSVLLDLNKRSLRQALDLLGRIDGNQFATSPPGLATHRVNGHLRHILEFYECFLDGLAPARIDYDARKRDITIESSRAAAAARICAIIDRLETDPALLTDAHLFVRAEDADAMQLADPYLASSMGRELAVLSSHTIHHFALIAMTLRAHGVELDPDFGMALSTLRHRERQLAPAAETA
jgi:uncharacterized damage-inducible protein DinB